MNYLHTTPNAKLSFYPLILKKKYLKLSINSSDKSTGKELRYRDINPLKLRHLGVTYATTDKLLSKSCEGRTCNSSGDILFRHKEIISICHSLKTSGQYSVFYSNVAMMQIATLLLTVSNVYN